MKRKQSNQKRDLIDRIQLEIAFEIRDLLTAQRRILTEMSNTIKQAVPEEPSPEN